MNVSEELKKLAKVGSVEVSTYVNYDGTGGLFSLKMAVLRTQLEITGSSLEEAIEKTKARINKIRESLTL